jgi:membrane associated rhomboid family serine protease
LIPYKDDNPTPGFPYVTVGLIALNVLVFLWQMATDPFVMAYRYGALPAALLSWERVQPIHPGLTVFTSMFLHGGLLHIVGNMLYLWIFGDNIEHRLGRVRFIIFYALSGVAAVFAHALTEPGSTVPMIGASGAVSGVLGAYVLLYPRAHVYTLLLLGFFVQVVRLPALVVIGFWAVIQLLSGISSSVVGQGGVAWFAHVGGFVFGIGSVKLFIMGKKRRRVQWS